MPQSISIVISGHIARIIPAIPSIVAALTCTERRVDFPHGRAIWHDRRKCFYEFAADGALNIPSGSVVRVAKLLERDGHAVTIEDLRTALPLLAVDDTYSQTLQDRPSQVARCAANSHGGIIVADGENEMLASVGMLAQLHRPARVLVAAATVAQCDCIYEALKEWGSKKISRLDRNSWLDCEPVAVATFQRLDINGVDDWDVIVLPFADQALEMKIVRSLDFEGTKRFYALISHSASLPKETVLRLEMLAGPIISDCSAPPSTNVRVHMCDAIAFPVNRGESSIARKRQGIWRNEARNKLIVDIAQAIASQNLSRLDQLGLHGIEPAHFGFGAPTMSPVIIVESPEHARELSRELPGWELRQRPNDQSHHGTNETAVAAAGAGLVCTQLAASQLLFAFNSFIIRADGGRHGLELPALRQRSATVTLIDFVDDGDEQATEDTKGRIRAYQEKDWIVSAPAWLLASINTAAARRTRRGV